MARAAARVAARSEEHLERRLQTHAERNGARIRIDGAWLRNFTSNDYLGLSTHPRVQKALVDAVARHGAGSGAAHLLGGHARAHAALEERIAEWLGFPAALLCGSGYQANLGVAMSLLDPGEVLLGDRLNHASLIDAARIAGVRLLRYPHADAAGAARQLQRVPATECALLATDGVFSMDGDSAPLSELVSITRAAGAGLWVDDAHGCGVLGPGGRGSLHAASVEPRDVEVLTVTLGKAFGTAGALILGSQELIRALLQFARPYIYSTAAPPAWAQATLAALELVQGDEGESLRVRLQQRIAQWRAGARALGLPLLESATAIQPLLLGDAAAALAAQATLRAKGFLVGAVRPPTVPAGKSRLRITLSALHGVADIDELLAECASCSVVRAAAS